jgi:hypothetical protein
MRTFIIILCILAVAVGAVVVYLVVTTPKEAAALHFPLTDAQGGLLVHVPADAEAYALVPAPAVLMAKLTANPITLDTVTRWTREQAMPPASMLGRAEVVIWKSGKLTSYAVRLDPLRAILVRVWTMFSDVDAQWDGYTLIVNGGEHVRSAVPAEVSLAGHLPPGDAFVVQRREFRGAFPPIGRPALTSVSVSERQIEITSRAVKGGVQNEVRPAVSATLPRSALLAIAFTDPPRALGDLDRLRPFMAIAVPANEQSRLTLARYDDLLDVVGRKAEQDGELVISFDRDTAGQYLKDARAPLPWPANRWSLRLDPPRLIPVLRKVGDNPALRFATPRIHRGARDLRRWMGALEQAASVEAASSVSGDQEELRVRITAK